MSTESPPKRPLSSLTAEEYQTLFALAFGYAPPLDRLKTFSLGAHYPLNIYDQSFMLILYWDGNMIAQRHSDQCASFNARKLIGYLDSHNVQFGPEETPASTPAEQ